jgi:hypothetical protein
VNVRFLLKSLRDRGVNLKAAGEALHVDAPPGVVTPEILEQLTQSKAQVLKLLAGEERRERERWERGVDPRWSYNRGYIKLHDPTTGEVHEFPRKDCFESMVQDANSTRRKDKEGA